METMAHGETDTAAVAASTTTTAPTSNAVCFICCESTALHCLSSSCSHQRCCQACLVRWIETEEANGQVDLPSCPYCRVQMTADETKRLLGRPFQPRGVNYSRSPRQSYEMDVLTMQLLQEQTRACPSCGIPIMKLDGCDLMECLCGFRFCFQCGAPGARCNCTSNTHTFWDNLFDRASPRVIPLSRPEAAVDEQTGVINLRQFIQERLDEEQIRLREMEHRRIRAVVEYSVRRKLNARQRQKQERRVRAAVQEKLFQQTLRDVHFLYMDDDELSERRERHHRFHEARRVMEEMLRRKRREMRRRRRNRYLQIKMQKYLADQALMEMHRLFFLDEEDEEAAEDSEGIEDRNHEEVVGFCSVLSVGCSR